MIADIFVSVTNFIDTILKKERVIGAVSVEEMSHTIVVTTVTESSTTSEIQILDKLIYVQTVINRSHVNVNMDRMV